MNYPLISEYIESIKFAEDNFEELSYLRPVLDAEGQPVMSSGNFAVVFKMKDERDGKLYAVRCFHRDQEGREESYRLIEEELKDVESPYLVSFRYMDKELFVDSSQTDETEFPVLLMDWVEGITLDKYLRENLDDQYALEMLAYRFSQLAQWLIPQPFAHGDLKPDNILVREDGTLVLVDYDGMYVPAMKGQKARELGSPDFRHPLRTEEDFDEHIDDFPLVSILLSLKAISIKKDLLLEADNDSGVLLTREDYYDMANSKMIKSLCNVAGDSDYYRLLGSFFICNANSSFSNVTFKLLCIHCSQGNHSNMGYFKDSRDGYTYKTIKMGSQIWLAENLRYLPEIGNGYYVYDYKGESVDGAKETQNYKDFGVLYNMSAAQNACPAGWHIPSDEEWKELERYLGMPEDEIQRFIERAGGDIDTYTFRGGNQGSNLMDKKGKQKDGELKENQTRDYGFRASLGGWKTYHREYKGLYEDVKWWSRSIYKANFYIFRELYYKATGINKDYCADDCCLYLRCVKDNYNNLI